MDINTKYKLEQKVRNYYTKIKDGKVTKELGVNILKIKGIYIYKDILENEICYMYQLEDGRLYHEKNIVLVNN